MKVTKERNIKNILQKGLGLILGLVLTAGIITLCGVSEIYAVETAAVQTESEPLGETGLQTEAQAQPTQPLATEISVPETESTGLVENTDTPDVVKIMRIAIIGMIVLVVVIVILAVFNGLQAPRQFKKDWDHKKSRLEKKQIEEALQKARAQEEDEDEEDGEDASDHNLKD